MSPFNEFEGKASLRRGQVVIGIWHAGRNERAKEGAEQTERRPASSRGPDRQDSESAGAKEGERGWRLTHRLTSSPACLSWNSGQEHEPREPAQRRRGRSRPTQATASRSTSTIQLVQGGPPQSEGPGPGQLFRLELHSLEPGRCWLKAAS